VRYEPGSHHPLHKHDFAQVWYILEGQFQIGERTYSGRFNMTARKPVAEENLER
jgi:quercetin dioxygenase-like cupin family protein